MAGSRGNSYMKAHHRPSQASERMRNTGGSPEGASRQPSSAGSLASEDLLHPEKRRSSTYGALVSLPRSLGLPASSRAAQFGTRQQATAPLWSMWRWSSLAASAHGLVHRSRFKNPWGGPRPMHEIATCFLHLGWARAPLMLLPLPAAFRHPSGILPASSAKSAAMHHKRAHSQMSKCVRQLDDGVSRRIVICNRTQT